MAESKGALIAKSLQKHAGRTKEKILQNLGKVDRTADEIFDEHLQNFNKQQAQTSRLQKEFNNYIRCIRAAQVASKSLWDAVSDVYETSWQGRELVVQNTQALDVLWQDYSHKLADQVLIPLNTYQAQFPETKKKIDKRGRKLVDFDKERHNLQSLQNSSQGKQRNETRLGKARESLDEARRTYEVLNSELHDELPALYDSRVLFIVTHLQTLFASEHLFHTETAKIFTELESIADKLATDCQRGAYTLRKNATFNSNTASPKSPISSNSTNGNASLPASPASEKNLSGVVAMNSSSFNDTTTTTPNGNAKQPSSLSPPNTPPSSPPTGVASALVNSSPTASSPPPPPLPSTNNVPAANKNSNNPEELYDIPVGATTENLPPGVLYRVKATYKYSREDVDELSFEIGEIIKVVEYEDPEEQEEGWLMGIKEGTNEKGMFPANFTRPI
ncbi:amphiphysin isoform X1 [Neocloeon triangulifer]|uniref:amphiphysin isoform X1 n=1 Tax=Neocloeon triangulifer TaxID=2078957 RepID=UPI00286F1D37|nr:amphiphysin isoform X1 [Neocloeon triangulifer]